jgi:hypothetical protein
MFFRILITFFNQIVIESIYQISTKLIKQLLK